MKTWFITGANRGIGYEIARTALEAGDQVVATSRKPDTVRAKLAPFADRLLAVQLDVTDSASIRTAVDEAVGTFKTIDVLVNNAGYGQLGVFEEVSEPAVHRQFATNLFGVLSVTRCVLPVMRAQRRGRIFTMSSIGGLVGFNGSSIYCATKFAIEGWSESLDQEIRPFGIRATIIEPGFFRTDFLDASSVGFGDLPIADYHDYTTQRRLELDRLNHKQAGDPRKLGHALLALATADDPPVRFAAGSDAYRIVMDRAETLRATAQPWRALSESTDIQE